MADEDIKAVGESAPTIDGITLAEFESHATLKEWITAHAPAFVNAKD